MDWTKTLAFVADAAPLLGSLLPIPGAGIAGTLIAAAFGTDNDPQSLAKAIAADPQAAAKLRRIELENQAALQAQVIAAETARLTQINRTMRIEAASADAYVRRWRPTFGYVVAASWGFMVFMVSGAIIYVAIVAPDGTAAILGGIAEILGAMTVLWPVALAVLGVSVSSRSKDKALAAGQAPGAGVLGALARRIAGAAK